MEFGPYKHNGNNITKKKSPDSKYDLGSAKNQTDLARLFLLSCMLIAAIFGGYYNSVSNKPEMIIKRSVNKSLKRSFRASMEGSASLKGSIKNIYRGHQKYDPERGLSILSDTSSSNQAPFDAVKAIEMLRYAKNATEYAREDMYGHGTRHLGGSLKLPGDDGSVAHVFEYWIDMRSLLAVRLDIAKVVRNVSIDSEGNPVSKEIYINFRYHDWR